MPTLLSPRGTREGGIRATYVNGMIEREEDWHFNVLADDIDQNRADILFNTPGLPVIGVTISNNMLCKGGDAQRDPDKALLWRVSLTFTDSLDQNDAANNNAQQGGDPTLWVPVRRLLYDTKEEIMDTDASGNPCVNTADQPFTTKMTRKRFLPAWEFTQFEPAAVSDVAVLANNEVMNDGIWPPNSGLEARTWFCRVLDSIVGFYAGYRCRMTIYRVTYDFKKWTDKRLSVGNLYKNGSNRFPYIVRGQLIEGPLTSTGDRVIDENGATISGRTLHTVELDPVPVVDFTSFLRIT